MTAYAATGPRGSEPQKWRPRGSKPRRRSESQSPEAGLGSERRFSKK
jgi:hypothetical protein